MTVEIFGANLKQYIQPTEQKTATRQLLDLLLDYSQQINVTGSDKEVVIFVPNYYGRTSMLACGRQLAASGIRLGIQDISASVEGAHTAQTSPRWVTEDGITDILVGHSEVRELYEKMGADPTRINQEFRRIIETALEYNIQVTYCIGETEAEKEQGRTECVLETQLNTGLAGLAGHGLGSNLIIAYEPRYLIGGDKEPLTPEKIREVHRFIQEIMDNQYGIKVPIQYGGSMNPGNAAEIMAVEEVSGGLIGSASKNAETFKQIVFHD
jgi:triosephosphate isomerase